MSSRRDIVVACALFLAGALAASFQSRDPDVYFHLAMGREVASSGFSSEHMCLFSEGNDAPNQSWLYDLLLWYAYDGLGEAGVHLVRVLWAGLVFGAGGLLCRRRGAGFSVALVAPLFFVPLVREWLEVRPHVAGYALAALVLLSLDALSRGRKGAMVALFLLFALWANVHGSFPLGVILVACQTSVSLASSDRNRIRRDLFALTLAIAGTCLTPFGPGPWGVALAHLDSRYRASIPEWQGTVLGSSPLLDGLLVVLSVALFAGFLLRARRRAVLELLHLIALGVPGLLVKRFVLGLLVGGAPALAVHAGYLGTRAVVIAGTGLGLLGGIGIATSGTPPGVGFDRAERPEAAIKAALDRGVEGGLFGPMEAGGYVELAAYPRLRPFIDGRVYVHGVEGVQEYLKALERPVDFDKLDDQWHFGAVLVDITHPAFLRLAQWLVSSERFAMVWLDSRYALFVRAGSEAARGAYRVLRPTTDPRYLLSLRDVHAAREEVERVLVAPEGRILGLLLRGVLALREAGMTLNELPQGHAPACGRAKADFAELVALRPDVEMFRVFLQVASRCTGP